MNQASSSLPRIEDLPTYRLPELQKLYARVMGEPTRSPNKTFLIRRITEALDEIAAIEDFERHAQLAAEAGGQDEAQDTAEAGGQETAMASLEDAHDDVGEDAEPTLAEPEADATAGKRLSKLTIEELQQRYVEVVGRPTGSRHRGYLLWKIGQAEKGKVPVGPRNRRNPGQPAPDFKILPIRMETEVVELVDEARVRLGLGSRMDLFRSALRMYFDARGEADLAALFAPRS